MTTIRSTNTRNTKRSPKTTAPVAETKGEIRLNKLIAQSGLASRRHADELISEGSVQINGKKVYELGRKVDPKVDKILVNGKPLKSELRSVYLMLNKPKHVLTTMDDPEGRPCIGDLLRRFPIRVFPVGRLDWDSEGLILLTNDGEFAQKVSHPSHKVPKTYIVKLERDPTPAQVQKLLSGLSIPGGRAKAVKLERIFKSREGSHPWYQIIIEEGINRQIRNMFGKFNIDVIKLQRVAIGHLRLGQLPRGMLVDLDDADLARIFRPLQPKSEAQKSKEVRRNQSLKRL